MASVPKAGTQKLALLLSGADGSVGVCGIYTLPGANLVIRVSAVLPVVCISPSPGSYPEGEMQTAGERVITRVLGLPRHRCMSHIHQQ